MMPVISANSSTSSRMICRRLAMAEDCELCKVAEGCGSETPPPLCPPCIKNEMLHAFHNRNNEGIPPHLAAPVAAVAPHLHRFVLSETLNMTCSAAARAASALLVRDAQGPHLARSAGGNVLRNNPRLQKQSSKPEALLEQQQAHCVPACAAPQALCAGSAAANNHVRDQGNAHIDRFIRASEL